MAASINITQILNDAKALGRKLQQDEKATELLICRAQSVTEKIFCLKEYKDNINDLHEMRVAQRPRSALVRSLQQENRQIKILQEENRHLKVALDEHQATIELIMTRYRQQVADLIKLNNAQKSAICLVDELKLSSADIGTDKNLLKFAFLFDQCLKSGEEASRKDRHELTHLQSENLLLRRLLKITSDFDSTS